MNRLPPLFKKWDLLPLLLLLVSALIGFQCLAKKPGKMAEIRINGSSYAQLSLGEDTTFSISNNGYHLTVSVQNTAIAIVSCDCPDQICVKTGWIKQVGQTAVCLPAACSVRVEGSPLVDGITY